jgi:2-polyprenyl-3-methyl-5-hydroxy-6-metoxy-1,4-benzoquinol methylase
VTKTPEGFYEVNTRPHGSQMKLIELVDPPARVLDVGCSTGYLAQRLQERGATVIGIELDERAAELARRFCEAVYVGDIETMELPFDSQSFDVVLCGDLIEHLREPQGVLARLRPLLRPGGRLVLSTPNIANWAMRLSLLFGRFRYTDWGILDRTHTHFFTRKTLRETLEAAGYRIEVFDHTAPVPVLSTPGVESVAHKIARLRPSLFAYQFVVAAVPAHEQVAGDDRAHDPEDRERPARVGAAGRKA